ncbi:hypothetical protein HMPREF0083_00706 [Aneurinibacillus aneurinilyticus ATCC 12856]|jgi:hypothetical protein|uniref:Uncharacterized protein n=1 Tax=Aneurinibacillus aneurinilyticus ATCC 12856 TaxID=649747 RepID=U1X9C8_ANEAE|nr:hypothetical protein HMPREF0083_00706 [Aneurinibacillus aneurinilyticus ATCC 12856]
MRGVGSMPEMDFRTKRISRGRKSGQVCRFYIGFLFWDEADIFGRIGGFYSAG